MMLILFHLLMSVATAQERPPDHDWVQAVVDEIGHELVYTQGVYVLPVVHLADYAFAEQFAVDHDADLRSLAPEGIKIGVIEPGHPRVWFRPDLPPVELPLWDLPRFGGWPRVDDPRTLQRLVQVQERLYQGATNRGDLMNLREKLIVHACGKEL